MSDYVLHARAAAMFVPSAFLPVQYFDRMRRRTLPTGEQRLMYAVVEQAVDDYLKHAHAVDLRGRRLFAEVARWVDSADRSRLYSFATICDHLGLDAEYIRRGLRARRCRRIAPVEHRGDAQEAFQ